MSRPNSLSVTTEITKKITVSNKKGWYITFTMDSEWKCVGYDSNLSFYKDLNEWNFVAEAIRRMVREVRR